MCIQCDVCATFLCDFKKSVTFLLNFIKEYWHACQSWTRNEQSKNIHIRESGLLKEEFLTLNRISQTGLPHSDQGKIPFVFQSFTGRNEVVAKVMFLLVSVILSTGGGSLCKETPARKKAAPSKETPQEGGTPSPWQEDPPGRRQTPGKETPQEGGTPPGRRPPRKEAPQQGDPPGRRPPGKEAPPPPAYGQ